LNLCTRLWINNHAKNFKLTNKEKTPFAIKKEKEKEKLKITFGKKIKIKIKIKENLEN
jgi:hypothetical protein